MCPCDMYVRVCVVCVVHMCTMQTQSANPEGGLARASECVWGQVTDLDCPRAQQPWMEPLL